VAIFLVEKLGPLTDTTGHLTSCRTSLCFILRQFSLCHSDRILANNVSRICNLISVFMFIQKHYMNQLNKGRDVITFGTLCTHVNCNTVPWHSRQQLAVWHFVILWVSVGAR